MRRYQQKLLNQSYSAHISNLRLIKNRKPLHEEGVLTRIHNNQHYLQKKKIKLENQRLLKSIQNPKRSLLSSHSNAKRNQSAQQKLKKLRFQNTLLESKILNAEPMISTFQKIVPIVNSSKQPYNKLNETSNIARMEKLKQFMTEERRSVKEIGRGTSKILMTIKSINIFSSKILKENMNHISFEFYIGNTVYQSRLIQPSQLVGQKLYVKFTKEKLIDSEILVAVQQYRGINNHNLGYFQIDNNQLKSHQSQTESKFIYKNREEPVGLIEYQISLEV